MLSILKIASIAVSAIAAWLFYTPIAKWLNDTIFNSVVVSSIKNGILALSDDGNVKSLFLNPPAQLESFLANLNFDTADLKVKFIESNLSAEQFVDNISHYIADDISYMLSSAIVLIGLFIVFYIGCSIASVFINIIFKLPILNAANKLLGLCFGIVGALIFAWIFSHGTILFFNGMKAIDPQMYNNNMIERSFLINFFYNFNPQAFFR